jgi:hypothetical protein
LVRTHTDQRTTRVAACRTAMKSTR